MNRATEERFRMCANKEAEFEWKENKDKLDKKIKHLEKKYCKEGVADNIREIKNQTKPSELRSRKLIQSFTTLKRRLFQTM